MGDNAPAAVDPALVAKIAAAAREQEAVEEANAAMLAPVEDPNRNNYRDTAYAAREERRQHRARQAIAGGQDPRELIDDYEHANRGVPGTGTSRSIERG